MDSWNKSCNARVPGKALQRDKRYNKRVKARTIRRLPIGDETIANKLTKGAWNII